MKLSYANIASTAALVIAVGGGGVAVAAGLAENSVGSPQIKDGAVKVVDMNSKATAKFVAGPPAFHDSLAFHDLSSANADTTIFEFDVPSGNYLVTASGTVSNTGADTNDFTCRVTQPIGDFARTIAAGEVRLANGGDNGVVSVSGVAVKTAGTMTLTMTCDAQLAPYTGKINEPRIAVVRLGTATEK